VSYLLLRVTAQLESRVLEQQQQSCLMWQHGRNLPSKPCSTASRTNTEKRLYSYPPAPQKLRLRLHCKTTSADLFSTPLLRTTSTMIHSLDTSGLCLIT